MCVYVCRRPLCLLFNFINWIIERETCMYNVRNAFLMLDVRFVTFEVAFTAIEYFLNYVIYRNDRFVYLKYFLRI